MIINGKEIKKLGNYYYLLTILYSRTNKIKIEKRNKEISKDISIQELSNKLKESNLLNEYFKKEKILTKNSNRFCPNNELRIENIYDLLMTDLTNDEYVNKSNITEEVKYLTYFHRKYIKDHTLFFDDEKNSHINKKMDKYSSSILSDICLETINPIVRLASYTHLKSFDLKL